MSDPAAPAGSPDAGPDQPEEQHPDQPDVHRTRIRTRIRIETPPPSKHWYRPRNTVLIPLLVLLLVVAGFLLYANAQLAGIRRATLLPPYDAPAGVGTNILLVGSEASPGSLALALPTTVVQLVHLSADRRQAAVVDVPRDLLLPRPATSRGGRRDAAGGRETPAQAYARGGDPVLVQLVASALGVRVDHVVQVAFSAYARVTDRLGGVDMPTALGERHFDGSTALSYADDPAAPGGSVETGHRHQQWLKAMLAATVRPSVLLDPLTLLGLLRDTTPRIVVDDTFTTGTMRSLLWSSRRLGPDAIHYLTAPYRRYAKVDGARVLLPDASALAQLAQALHTDNQAALATFLG